MKEALKLALEALNWSTPHEGAVITHEEAITAIKAALAQPAKQCLDCGSNNIGIPATYDSLIDSVKTSQENT
jgi:hypothetical protein